MSQQSRRARKKAVLRQSQRTTRERKFMAITASLLLVLSFAGVLIAKRTAGNAAFFAPQPVPTPIPTPLTLAKEYVYAGSKLVATEDIAPHYSTDLAVWRLSGSTGTWYVLKGDGSIISQDWGTTADIPAMGDYDGDQKTDFAIFRQSNTTWYILHSSDGSLHFYQWGQSTDTPAPADYDGDGKTDIAVFRSSDNTWNVLKSSGGTITQQFGASGDQPVPSDYDGDGKADFAVWRNSNSSWYYLKSTDNATGGQAWGQSGDKPVPGDYDGDGKTDLAVFQSVSGGNGVWSILNSSNGTTTTQQWGLYNDRTVQGDYDADGKTDIAVWRASSGYWYIQQSGSNNSLRSEHFGQNGDIPVPAPYRR